MTSETTSDRTPTVFTAHDPSDLFNLMPTLFGFMPEESICAIGTTGPRARFGFRMRVDLPTDPEHVPQLARFVAGHLRNNGADGAIVLVVSRRVAEAAAAAWAVERSLAPVRPVVTAWTDTERYWTTFEDDDPAGTPLELSDHHPAIVSAVVAGQEVLADRATLARRWEPEHGPAREWLSAQVGQVERTLVARTWQLPESEAAALGLREVLDVVEAARGGERPDDSALLTACVWLTHHGVRDRLWTHYGRDDAEDLVVAWRDLARRAPREYAAVPYTVAGYLAYLVGDGAQASMGLEQARAADPTYSMAETLQGVLMSGVHPDEVQRVVSGCARVGLEGGERPRFDPR